MRSSVPTKRRVLTAAAAAVALVISGCGGGSGTKAESTRRDRGTTLVTTTPAGKGDVARMSWALPDGEPTTIDPAKSGTESSNTVVVNLCDSLLRLNPDWSIGQALATKADWSDDTHFVIDVRDGVTFWDGTPLTAADVAFSMTRQMDPKTEAVNINNFELVDKIEQTGPLQVTLTFKQHDALFRNTLVAVAGEVVSKAFAQKAGGDLGTPDGGLMCSGPYKLVKWTSGESIVIAANPAWWGGTPHVKEVDFKFIADSATLTSALNAGEVDGSFALPSGSLTALEKSKNGKVYLGPSTSSVSLSPTTDEGPMADPKVRAALDLAIDKDAFIKNQLFGAGRPQKTLTPELAWSGDPEAATYRAGYEALPSNAQNLAEAKKLVAEAKPEAKKMAIVVGAGNQMTLQVATLAQQAGKELGLDFEIKQLQPTDFSAFFYSKDSRKQGDLVATVGYQEGPGSLGYAPLFALPGGIFNWSGYDNPDVTAKLKAARSFNDPAQTAKAFVDAQAVFGPDRLQISLANLYSSVFLNNRITGSPASFSYISSPWAASIGSAE